jgi:zinc protease
MTTAALHACRPFVHRLTTVHKLLVVLAVVTSWPVSAQGLAAKAGTKPPSVSVARPSAGVALQAVRSVEGITEYRLPNGLQLLLAPDDSKPTTTVNLTFRVGSRHENYGETGMAHLLEHMLFKGTPRHPTVWAEFNKRGLRANGTTWLDRTNYFASFSASDENLRWYVGWLADAMVNSYIARKDLDSEMTVVRNEMEMGENNPGNMLFAQMLATMYRWHNYGKDTIGARADVEGVDIGRLQAFYRLYYQPDNATLTVSGRFNPAQVKQLVGQTFGPIPKPTRKLPALYTLEPTQDGERSVTLRRVGGAPALMAGYHSVPGAHPDHAAIELLGLVMGDSPSGRLHQRLTDKGLAASTWGWTTPLHDPGFVAFGADLAPDQDVAAAREALLATLEGADGQAITEQELQRAKAKWLKAWEAAFSNPEQVGVSLSEAIAQGDWRLFFLLRDRVRDARLADVQRVARERLIPANRTLGTYLPTPSPLRSPAPANVDLAAELKGFVPQAAAATAEAFDATPANIDARTQIGSSAGIRTALLAKGTRGAAVHARFALRMGSAQSLMGQEEVAAFVTQALDKGSVGLNRQAVQDRLDALRTQWAFGFQDGVLTVQMQSRREHLPAALELLGRVLRQPSFEPGVVEELRRQFLAAIEAERKEPEALAMEAVGRHGNPYPRGDLRHARSFDEREADVKAITPVALKAFHERFFGIGTAEFAAVGDMDAAAVRAALEAAFAGWKPAATYERLPQPRVEPPPLRQLIRTPDKQNATLLVRQRLALKETDAQWPALLLANYLLGNGGNSRLWVRIRETGGLSYDVYSSLQAGQDPREANAQWVAGAIFAPSNRAKVEAAFNEEVARALKEGFTAKELAEGKTGLLNFRRLSRAQDAGLAAALARNLDLDRRLAFAQGIDEALQRLTLEQVNAALRQHIKPSAFVTVWAGDFKE